MEFDELLITTGVDALVRLIKEKQRIELEEASSILNIAPETIEEWARVLEEEGILRIEYRLTRVYLLWVKPTEEEIAVEKESFYEEKKGIEAEVEGYKRKAAEEIGDIEELRRSFAEFYKKAYPRLEQLEKAVAPLPAGKTISEDLLAKQAAATAQIAAELESIKKGLQEIKRETAKLGIEKGESESKKWMDKIEKMNSELAAMESQMEELRKRAGKEAGAVTLPSMAEMKKKFDGIKKDFADMRAKNARLREDMISLHESSEILKSVAEAIMGHEERVQNLHDEMAALSTEADKLLGKVKDVAAKAKENLELTERFGDSVTVAKGILRRFPSQEKVLQELDKLDATEKALAEKTDAVEKLLEAAGGKQLTAKQMADLLKKMDERMVQIRKDMDALATSLEDEKSTYLAFQKIREKVVPAMEGYQKQVDGIDARIAKARQDMVAQQEALRADAKKIQESLRGGEMQDALKLAEDVRERKKSLEEVRQALEELDAASENLNKRLTLLAREAKLLEIRTGGEAGKEAEAKRAELKHELELSEAEEMEFRKKREELKKLIKKLWEQ